MSLADDINQAMSEQTPQSQNIFAGTINTVDPLTVTLDGSGVALPCLVFGQVTLTESRRVGIIKVGADLVVFGSFGDDTILRGSLHVPDELTWGVATTLPSSVGTLLNAASTGFVAIGIGVVFKAPPSGQVNIHFAAQLIIHTANASVTVSPHVKYGTSIGAGSDIVTANNTHCIELEGPSTLAGDSINVGSFRFINGLIPGDSYNVELRHKSSPAGTGDTNKHRVLVVPVL